ncbi:alpha/beta-hydrolase, partial [Meira miltonrushii]
MYERPVIPTEPIPYTPKHSRISPSSSPSPSPAPSPGPASSQKSHALSDTEDINELMRHPALLNHIKAPRNPIILCHGLYGFDVRGPFWGLEIHYWATVLDILRKKVGADVIVRGVPGTGAIADRAEALHKYLCSEEAGIKGKQVNFIGHSMGGLDARYLISVLKPAPEQYTPISLTSLSTPHRGSPFMDWCNANVGTGNDRSNEEAKPDTDQKESGKKKKNGKDSPLIDFSLFNRALSSIGGSFSSYMLSVLDQPAYAMLSTRYMAQVFNPTVPNSPDVAYFSVASRKRSLPIYHPLWLPKLILDAAAESRTAGGERDGSADALGSKSQGNDGLVSVESAKWGKFLGIIDGCDHWDLRG